MKRASVTRLFLLLIIVALGLTAAPGQAFLTCPSHWDYCDDLNANCIANGGTPNSTLYPQICWDQYGYFRSMGQLTCTYPSGYEQQWECVGGG